LAAKCFFGTPAPEPTHCQLSSFFRAPIQAVHHLGSFIPARMYLWFSQSFETSKNRSHSSSLSMVANLPPACFANLSASCQEKTTHQYLCLYSYSLLGAVRRHAIFECPELIF